MNTEINYGVKATYEGCFKPIEDPKEVYLKKLIRKDFDETEHWDKDKLNLIIESAESLSFYDLAWKMKLDLE